MLIIITMLKCYQGTSEYMLHWRNKANLVLKIMALGHIEAYY